MQIRLHSSHWSRYAAPVVHSSRPLSSHRLSWRFYLETMQTQWHPCLCRRQRKVRLPPGMLLVNTYSEGNPWWWPRHSERCTSSKATLSMWTRHLNKPSRSPLSSGVWLGDDLTRKSTIVHLVRVLTLAPQIFGKVYAPLTLSTKIEAGDSSYDTVLPEIVSDNADDTTQMIELR